MVRRIGLLTGGGDCPGMNAAVRAVAKSAIIKHGYQVVGFEDGFDGLVTGRQRVMSYADVSGILDWGGTVLGTSNTADPYQYAVKQGSVLVKADVSKTALKTIEDAKIECLVCIGGDGSFSIANRLSRDGVNVVGVPKTIDNDVVGTDITVGFDTAVSIATGAIDRVRTTAESHHRVMVVEVMGRNAGWLGLYSGVASGGDVILIPEIPYDIEAIAGVVRRRSQVGKRFTIVVIAEGARERGGQVTVRQFVEAGHDKIRLGGVGFVLASQIERMTETESRAVVLGHLLRGGSPTASDRLLATRMGSFAVELLASKKYGRMVGVQGDTLHPVELEQAADCQRKVREEDSMVEAAHAVGTSFGVAIS